MRPVWLIAIPAAVSALLAARQFAANPHHPPTTRSAYAVQKTDAEWKHALTPEQYEVLRQKGTEAPFTGKYWNLKDDGTYRCAACGAALFKSDTKFDAGCGWPSFWEAADKNAVEFHDDDSYGMHRVEVVCKHCGGHLGHVFDDGPNPTGKRFCINSAALNFKPAEHPKKGQ